MIRHVAVYAGLYSTLDEVVTVKTLLQKDHQIKLVSKGERVRTAVVVDPSVTEIPALKARHKIVIVVSKAYLPKSLSEYCQHGADDAFTTANGFGPAVTAVADLLKKS